jgi:hypothetical protein
MQSYKDSNGMPAIRWVTPLGGKTVDMTLNPMIQKISPMRVNLTPEFWETAREKTLGQAMDELCPDSIGKIRFVERGQLVVTEDLDVPNDNGPASADLSLH